MSPDACYSNYLAVIYYVIHVKLHVKSRQVFPVCCFARYFQVILEKSLDDFPLPFSHFHFVDVFILLPAIFSASFN